MAGKAETYQTENILIRIVHDVFPECGVQLGPELFRRDPSSSHPIIIVVSENVS